MGCCDSASRATAFRAIDGTPVHYIRNGSLQEATFYCANTFYSRLAFWVRHLRAVASNYGDSRYASLSYLVSAGAQVCRNDGCFSMDNFWNAAHHDHIHVDDKALPTVCLTSSRSDTVFTQRSCNDFLGKSLAVDGVWGATTDSAFVEACDKLNVVGDPHTSEPAWRNWCTRAAAHGIANQPFGAIAFPAV